MAMLEGRQRHDWSIAAAVMSIIANCNRDPKRSRPLKPADFDPFQQSRRTPGLAKVGVSVLKEVFIDHRLPEVVKELRT